MSSLYIYALLGEPPRGAPGVGFAGETLRVVDCGGLLAAAGELDALPPLDIETLRAHDAAIRRLAERTGAVLPVRFGALVPDERALAERLAPRAGPLREALALVEGCEQMTLRVYRAGAPQRAAGPCAGLPAEAVLPEPPPQAATADGGRLPGGPATSATSEAKPARPDGPDGGGPGTRYLAARRRAHAARAVPEIDPLRPALAPLLRAERAERHDRPPLLASVYHLVCRGRAPAYATALEAAARRLAGVRVAASGPWPPYAFAPAPLF